MKIVLASDNKYVQHCCVTMTSIMLHNRDVDFYVFTEGLDSKNISILEQQTKKYACSLTVVKVDSDIVSRMPMPSSASDHISVATYYRLFVSSLLPSSVDKVIYLDCDIVVRGSLSGLWNMDVDKYALSAVYQNNEWMDGNNTWERLSIPRDAGYFNAGVLLINLNYWRENNVEERLLNFIKNNYFSIHSHDQDTLNAVLYNESCPMDCTYNFLPNFFLNLRDITFPDKIDYKKRIPITKKNPVLVHYVYKPKPWESGCNHPYRKDYFRCLDKTIWKGWRPPINVGSIIQNRVKLPLLMWRHNIISYFKNNL